VVVMMDFLDAQAIVAPDATYTPFLADGYIGYKVERAGERPEFVSLVPSGGSDDGVATIFPYHGHTGDPGLDGSACSHHFAMFDGRPGTAPNYGAHEPAVCGLCGEAGYNVEAGHQCCEEA
jgi:hypothetical protein